MDAAQETELQTGLHIRVVTAPYFLATKLEAFRGRGRDDYANSHDLEDLLTVIDGRETLVQEVAGTLRLKKVLKSLLRIFTRIYDDPLSSFSFAANARANI